MAQRQPTAPRLLAVNGQDPAIYRRFAGIGRPLKVREVRISTGPAGRWFDRRIDHLPTPAEIEQIAEEG